MRGDLQFWRSSGAWYERLIVAATSNGDPAADFTHVSIDLGDGTIIEAQTRGVVRSPAPSLPDPRIVVYPVAFHAKNPAYVSAALTMMEKKVGHVVYGWLDIVSQFLRLLRLPFYIGRLHSLDCSHLAAIYAAWALTDSDLYDRVADEGADISPNDLARYLGVTAGDQRKAA